MQVLPAHTLLVHVPPQHSPSLVQAALSATHWLAEHTLPMQLVVQQSVFALHELPGIEQVVVLTVQLPVESHIFEQHVSLLAHGVPNTPHGLLRIIGSQSRAIANCSSSK